jgi:hypothetical protein
MSSSVVSSLAAVKMRQINLPKAAFGMVFTGGFPFAFSGSKIAALWQLKRITVGFKNQLKLIFSSTMQQQKSHLATKSR